MSWLVVKFDLENSVEAVSKNWYYEKTSTCYWPPDACNSFTIEEKIINQHIPDRSLWKSYPAVILGQYGIFCLLIMEIHNKSLYSFKHSCCLVFPFLIFSSYFIALFLNFFHFLNLFFQYIFSDVQTTSLSIHLIYILYMLYIAKFYKHLLIH